MGATSFITKMTGADPAHAFRNAVDQALFMNGHGGYTGTIAEKPSFVMCPIPSTPQFRLWLKDGIELESALATVGPQDMERGDAGQTRDELVKFVLEYDAGVEGWVNPEDKWLRRPYKAMSDLLRMATPEQVLRSFSVWDEKWGPALCIPTAVPNEYMFMGYASC